jgi:hypothetical protein
MHPEISNIAPGANVPISNAVLAMRSKPLLAAAAALPGVLLLWWATGVKSDVARMRADLAKAQGAAPARIAPAPANPAFAPMESSGLDSPAAGDTTASIPTGRERSQEELQQAMDRIAELEGTVKELTDAWNQFAADEEARRAQASTAPTVMVTNLDGGSDITTGFQAFDDLIIQSASVPNTNDDLRRVKLRAWTLGRQHAIGPNRGGNP